MEKISIAIAVDTPESGSALRTAARSRGLDVLFEQSPGSDIQVLADKIARFRPEIVFIEIPRVWGPPAAVIASLRAVDRATAIVIIHPDPDPEAILGAIRAGAAEFIFPPFAVNAGKSVERLLQERNGSSSSAGKTPPAGKTLGFLSVKGGCGATTLACHVAAEVQRSCGKSVLLADFDPDLGIVSFLLKTKSSYSVADALQNSERLDRSLWQAFAAAGPCGVSVLGAPEDPGMASPDPRQAADFFRFVRSGYDYTVVDLGRGVTRFNTAVMSDIDDTCLITTLDIPALHRTRKTIRTLLNSGCTAERLHLIVNNMPRHPEVSVAELEKMIDFPIYATVPLDSEAVSAAWSGNGLALPGSPLGEQIALLASRLTGQPVKESRKFRLFART